MALTVKVVGLPELQKKLNGRFLYQAEIEDALDTVVKRARRGGRGLGARMNPIHASTRRLSRDVVTPLRGDNRMAAFASYGRGAVPNPRFNPRVTGLAWLRKNLGAAWTTGVARGVLGSTATAALRKAVERIKAKWAS